MDNTIDSINTSDSFNASDSFKTSDSFNTSRTVVIAGLRLGTAWKLVWSAIGLFVAGGLVVLLMKLLLASRSGSGDLEPVFLLPMVVGYLFAFIFTLMAIGCIRTIFQCWKFLKISDNVLTITPDGIRDRRLLEEFVPWQAVKSVRTVAHEPDYYLAPHGPGRVTPVRRSMMDVVLELDPSLISQRFKDYAQISGMFREFGDRSPIKDTRPWMTFTIDLWRLKNTNVNTLYNVCEAYATAAQSKRAA
jgi:hypothetical protein